MLAEDKIQIEKILRILRMHTKHMPMPAIDQIVTHFGKNAYLILISCLLSLRAKDTVTIPVSFELFKLAQTPEALLRIPQSVLEKLLFPLGFYRKKAEILREVSSELITRFQGKVPDTEEELLSIKGVGRKTAAAVLGYAFAKSALCVDTHVHQIANRLGLVATKTPEQTEKELKIIVPHKDWIDLNRLLVMWGQNVCVPISPFCSKCALTKMCPKIGVKRSR